MGRTLKDVMNQSFAAHASRPALRVLRGDDGEGELCYEPLSYAELGALRDRLAGGLAQLGLRKGQRVGVLTDGGMEPLVVFLAADLLGLCAVPLCIKSPAEILLHGINHSGIEVLFVDRKGQAQFRRVQKLVERRVRLVLTEGRSEGALSWEEVLEMGGDGAPPEVEIFADDESKILYTSGSSGLPKGVVLTHANIVANVEEVWDLISRREPFRLFKSAPDYHSMGILNIYYPLSKGWVLDLARSPDRVLSDIRLSEPEGFLTVPLILDKVYGNVRREIEAGGLKGRLIARAVEGKRRIARGRAGAADRLFHAAVGGRVIAKVREQLARRVGRHLELLIIGSAKADPEALDFFHEVLDITAFEGYGTTECAPLIAANHLGGRKSGTVGRPLIQARIVGPGGQVLGHGDPATGQYLGSGGKTGELWVSGPNVMRGYLNDPDQTARVLVEEEGKVWYRTGDLFSMDEQGFLTFRGRVGRQFKLRNGEFVNPELLERLFARASLVEHVLVYGDQKQSFPLPLVSVDVEQAGKLKGIAGLPVEDEGALRTHPGVAEKVREQLLAEASAAGLPGHERPQRVLLLPEPLSEEAGTLTRGLRKVVPGAVFEKYREAIERAYGE